MKKTGLFSSCFAAGIALMGMCTAVIGAEGINIEIDGKPLETAVPAQIEEGRAMVPMRGVFEALNAEIQWDANTKTVTAKKGDTVIKMTAGLPLMEKNGKKQALDARVKIENGVTMVPLRAVSESFDCSVKWDDASKTVSIITPENKVAPEIPQWIKTVSTQISRPASLKDKLGDKQMFTTHDNGRYGFEQYALRTAIYSDDYAVKAVKSDSAFDNYIRKVWTDSVGNVPGKAHLVYKENIRTKTCKTDSGYAGIIAIAEDGGDVSCAYIAVLYDEGKGFRIYTLENDSLADGYFVCYINARGRGTSDYIIDRDGAATPEKFLYAVSLIEEIE